MKSRRDKKFIYWSGRLIIRSSIKLKKDQRKEIKNLIIKIMSAPYYGCGYDIAREIVHMLDKGHRAIFSFNRIFYNLKIE